MSLRLFISSCASDGWFNVSIEAELFAMVNHTRNDRLMRPLLTYAFSDPWKGTIGAELYRGRLTLNSAA